MDYLDLYLIHAPQVVERGGGIERVWKDFEGLKKDRRVKSIGVSNFEIQDFEALFKVATIKPWVLSDNADLRSVNQIDYHVYNAIEHEELVKYSEKHGK